MGEHCRDIGEINRLMRGFAGFLTIKGNDHLSNPVYEDVQRILLGAMIAQRI